MDKPQQFSFSSQSVAAAYDTVLVPLLFDPWAVDMVEDLQPWDGRHVLDLATGTGILAQHLAHRVGTHGRVIGADINAAMLELARQRCADAPVAVEFVESPAAPLPLGDAEVDVVVCQQGFQFFPERAATAAEMLRVLRPGGRVAVSTWCSVDECEFIGAICRALESIGEADLSTLMRVPFDHMSDAELRRHFEGAGFEGVRVDRRKRELIMGQEAAQAVEAAYATPIGPKLRELPAEQQERFRGRLVDLVSDLCGGGNVVGCMVANVLSASKRA